MAFRDFVGKALRLPPGTQQRSFSDQSIDNVLNNNTLADQMGPGSVMPAQPLDNTGLPRRWDYRTAWNLPSQPGEGRIDFDTLLTLADIYDVLRKCIEIRKEEVARLPWDIVPVEGTPRQKLGQIQANRDKITEAKRFFRSPDKRWTWQDWIRALLEDHFVLDAVSIYKRRTYGGSLFALELLDGSRIKPLLDEQGRMPLPPSWAYQQYLYGIARYSFTNEELIYAPKNRRNRTPYGFCYAADTEILTQRGWRLFEDLDPTDLVATRSSDGYFEWQRPSHHTVQPYVGNLVHFKGPRIDLLVTPEHRMLVKDPSQPDAGYVFRDAAYFLDNPVTGFTLPLLSRWLGVPEDQLHLAPELPPLHLEREGTDYRFTMQSWLRFLALFLAHGRLGGADLDAPDGGPTDVVWLVLPFSKHDIRQAVVIDIFAELGLTPSYDEYRYSQGRQTRVFFKHPVLAEYLRRTVCGPGASAEPAHYSLPRAFMDLDNISLHIFLKAFIELNSDPLKRRDEVAIPLASAHLGDALLEVAQKSGFCAMLRPAPRVRPDAPHRQAAVHLIVGTTAPTALPAPVTQHYNGNVYCVTVPNGVVYVRRGGKPLWCGNSPVEYFANHINLALRQQIWTTSVFTDGNIPQQILSAPIEWSADQIAEFQDLWDAFLAGNPRNQRMLRLVPGGFAAVNTDNDGYLQFSREMQDYIINMTATCMDVTRQELGLEPSNTEGLGGSGHGQTMEGVQSRRSLLPLCSWLSWDIFNPILEQEFGLEGFTWVWPSITKQDPLQAAQLNQTLLSTGQKSLDEVLIENGEEPVGIGRIWLMGNQPFVEKDLIAMSAQGALKYMASQQPAQSSTSAVQGSPQAAPPPHPGGPVVARTATQQQLEHTQGSMQSARAKQIHAAGVHLKPGPVTGSEVPKAPKAPVQKAALRPLTDERRLEFLRWQRKCLKALQSGGPAVVPFASEHILGPEQRQVTRQLLRATTVPEVRKVFDTYLMKELAA